jgi:hypothetical protein
MELQEFISATLRSIIDGVKDAQEHAAKSAATVNPVGLFYNPNNTTILTHSESGIIAQQVHFDVAVTTTEGTQSKGGIRIFVGPVGVGAQGQSDATNSSVSRIKFSVPVLLPGQDRQDESAE